MAESEKLIQLNKKIAELKKRIQLAEGQKRALSEEWEKQKRTNSETIATLKKEIKELTEKLKDLKHPSTLKYVKQTKETGGKMDYPVGAKTAEEAVAMMDLKVIEVQKKHDLLRDKYLKKQQLFNKLVGEYKELLAYKTYDPKESNAAGPSGTSEENSNRKLVCHLENEIHRTNVQLMEAEHIRKKYRSIKASLMNDSERFERSLRELEEALTEQRAEINRLQQVHKEALEMRDAAKIILQRQEQQANISNRARERQALDFRKQVEERKMELERIERKLFSTGKNLIHQESVGSSTGDQLTDKAEHDDDPNAQLITKTTEMENIFKKLMEVTGATSAQEVLLRFLSQKDSTSRLTYLRTAAEAEKKHLEQQREDLSNELEILKFADAQDNEVNQEEVERLKLEIANYIQEEEECIQAIEKTKGIIKSISEALIEMIFKLQEVDECAIITIPTTGQVIPSNELGDFLNNDATDDDYIGMLEEKLTRAIKLMEAKETEEKPLEDVPDELNLDELLMPLGSPRESSVVEEKPQPLPLCYMNLMAGRAAHPSSASPGQSSQAAAASDDESEIPSRAYLKKQANIIVDAKSRRKGFRPSTQRRK